MKKRILIGLLITILIGIVFVMAAWPDNLTTNLVSYWKFDSTLTDSYGSNNGVAIGDLAYAPGIISNAIELDGVGDYVNFTDNSLFNFTKDNSFSISFWANISATPTDQTFFNKMLVNKGYELKTDSSRALTFRLCNTATTDCISLYTTDTISNGLWTHIVLIYNGSSDADQVRMFINNAETTNNIVNDNLGADTTTTVPFHIGADPQSGAGAPWFKGRIDEFSIWNKELNITEVAQLYNSGAGITYLAVGSQTLSVNLSSPANALISKDNNVTFVANATVSNLNFTNMSFYIWNSTDDVYNITTSVITGNSTNSSSILVELPVSNYKWNVYVCAKNTTDTGICGWAASNRTLTISPFSVSSVVYNNSILETSNQTFKVTINGTSAITSVTAKFYYNGSSYTSSVAESSTGIYVATNNIDIPLSVNPSANKSFNWEFTFLLNTGLTQTQNSSTYSNEVNKTYLNICNATHSVAYVNITTREAGNGFGLKNATFASTWNWWLGGGSVYRNYSYSDTTGSNSSFNFCMTPSYKNYTVDASIEIDATGYAKNFHYFNDALLSNTTNQLTLYLLNDSSATLTVLEVVDGSQSPIEDVYISIQLYDIGTDTFYTVSMAKTNFDGEDLVYLNWYDSLYKFVLVKDGSVIKTTSPYKISATPQTFEVITESVYDYEKYEGFIYNLYYNTTTQNFVLTFVKPSGEVDRGCLRVIKRNQTNDYTICETCETSSSATLYCNIAAWGNGTFIADFYAVGSPPKWITNLIETIGTNLNPLYDIIGNEDGTVMAIIFAGIVVSFFLFSPMMGVIGMLLGMLGAFALGFQPISYATFGGVVVVGVLIIWILKR